MGLLYRAARGEVVVIVECPACQTRYRVDGGIAVAGETSFECSQPDCGHIFIYAPPLLWKGGPEEPPVDIVPEQSPVAFSSPPQSDSQQNAYEQSDSDLAGPPGQTEHVECRRQAAHDSSIEKTAEIQAAEIIEDPEETSEDRAAAEEDRAAAEEDRAAAEEDRAAAEEDQPFFQPDGREDSLFQAMSKPSVFATGVQPDRVSPVFAPSAFESTNHLDDSRPDDSRPYDSRPDDHGREESDTFLSVRTILFTVALYVLGYAAIGYYALSHPHTTKLVLLQMPVLGPSFATEEFSTRHIQLTGLSGGFWLSKDSHRVFAVSGTAVNKASAPARLIQIESAIYNTEGKRVEQKKVFCGNAATENALNSLTVREIDTLQKLAPPRDFILPAGQQTECLTVFTKPPASIAELEGQVVSAQFRDKTKEPLISAQFDENTAGPPQL